MDFRGAVMTLLFCAVCGLLFRFLLPEGGVSRTAKVIVSLIMLSAVCAPLFGAWSALRGVEVPDGGIAGFGERDTTFPYESLEQEAAEAVAGVCGRIVDKYTSVSRQIAVSVHISEDNVIEIERVRILFEALPEGRDAMMAELTEECGVIPDIRVKTDDE